MPLSVIVCGHAPPWLVFTLWLVIGVLVTLLWRALHEQADRRIHPAPDNPLIRKKTAMTEPFPRQPTDV
jgi:membrane protein implicated in regulation of membrane protease activity